MIPDAECLKIVYEILSELDLGDFRIKVRSLTRTETLVINNQSKITFLPKMALK